MSLVCRNLNPMNKNTMGAFKQRARRIYQKASTESAKRRMNAHLEKYAESLVGTEPRIIRKSDRIQSELVPSEQSEINQVEYKPKKKTKKKKPKR